MQSELSLSLLDIFTYLFPGALTVIYYFLFDTSHIQQWRFSDTDKYILLFVLSYVIGHLVTLVSSLIPRISNVLRKKLKTKPSIERKSIIKNLTAEIQVTYNYAVSSEQLLSLSRQLVLEHCPSAGEFIRRLYAMSLFARNMVIVSLIYAFNFGLRQKALAWVFLIVFVLFILRYRRLNQSIENAIYRSAFLYLKFQKNETDNDK